jgi:hypothetical protein
MVLFTVFLLLINAFSYWGPNPQNIQEVAIFLPIVYFVSALLADWQAVETVRAAPCLCPG